MFGLDADERQRIFYGGGSAKAFDGAGAQVRALFDSGQLSFDTPPELEQVESASMRFCGEVIFGLLPRIIRAELVDAREFFAFFRFMVGMGLNQEDLAVHLGTSGKSVSRYANGEHCPSDVVKRRGVLIETHNLLVQKFYSFELYVQKSFRTEV